MFIPYCRSGAAFEPLLMTVRSAETKEEETRFELVLFGGKGIDYLQHPSGDQSEYLNDLWSLHISNTGFEWTQIQGVVPVDSSLTIGNQPEGRWMFGMDSYNSSSLVVFGGETGVMRAPMGLGDLWVYSSGSTVSLSSKTTDRAWLKVSTEGAPGARRALALAVTSDGEVVIHGGKPYQDNFICDSAIFTAPLGGGGVSTGDIEWMKGSELNATCRWGHTLTRSLVSVPIASTSLKENSGSSKSSPEVQYTEEERVVMFGGSNHDGSSYLSFNDLWYYDVPTAEWEKVDPGLPDESNDKSEEGLGPAERSGAPLPLARAFHAAVFVEELKSIFVHGGTTYTDKLTMPLSDMWSFSLRTKQWRQHQQSINRPVSRFGHGMAVWRGGAGDGDPTLVIMGGETVDHSGAESLMNDVWMFSIHTGEWRHVSESSCRPGATGYVSAEVTEADTTLAVIATIVAIAFLVIGVRMYKRNDYNQYLDLESSDPQISRSRSSIY